MDDQGFAIGTTIWIVPAETFLDEDNPWTADFIAEFDLISGPSARFPEQRRDLSYRAARIETIRRAASANVDKLLIVRSDPDAIQAVCHAEVERKLNIWPLRLYTWRYVVVPTDAVAGAPGDTVDTRRYMSKPRERMLRTANGFTIPLDDPAAAQIMAAHVADAHHGDEALDGVMGHLLDLFPDDADFCAESFGAVHDMLVYRTESDKERIKAPIDAESRAIAGKIASTRNEIEETLVLTAGTRELWSKASVSPLWHTLDPDSRATFNQAIEVMFGADFRAPGDIHHKAAFRDKSRKGKPAVNLISENFTFVREIEDRFEGAAQRFYESDLQRVMVRTAYGMAPGIIAWDKDPQNIG